MKLLCVLFFKFIFCLSQWFLAGLEQIQVYLDICNFSFKGCLAGKFFFLGIVWHDFLLLDLRL